VCIVEPHVTANYVKTLRFAQQRAFVKFITPAKKATYVGLHVNWPIFLFDGNKIWIFSRQVYRSLRYQIWKSNQWELRRYTRTDGRIWWSQLMLFATMRKCLKWHQVWQLC